MPAIDQFRQALEQTLRRLVGRSVRSVTYCELASDDGERMWNRESPSFDSLDFGVELLLDDASVVSFTWGWEIVSHNLSVSEAPIALGSGARRWRADERWRSLGFLDRPIARAWSVWEQGGDAREYPQEARIAFDSGAIAVISVTEHCGAEPATPMADHITIYFDDRAHDGSSGPS